MPTDRHTAPTGTGHWRPPPPPLVKRLPFIALAVLVAALVGVVAWALTAGSGRVAAVAESKNPLAREPSKKHAKAYLSKDDPTIAVDKLGPRKWKIIDIHEHLKGEEEALMLLKAMDKFGIQRTALMASTTYTLTLNPIYGFEGYRENSEAIIAVKKKWPDRFSAFTTFDPCGDYDPLALTKEFVAKGGDGVKLYLGHGASTPKFAFHCTRLDDPKLEPFFAWAEEVQLPILMHVNLEKFWDEMLNVLEKHPHLRVTLPHFGLHKNTEQRLKRLGWLLDRYPFVFTDISFGYYTFQIDGFEVLAKNRSRSKEFMTKYRDRVMYASDMVLEPSKDEAYVMDTLRSYLQFLEEERWRFFLVPRHTMHGMGLDDETLKHIYEVAPTSFLLLDKNGMSPDRTKDPKVTVDRPPVPPLDLSTIPPLVKPAGPQLPGTTPAKGDDKDDDKPASEAGCEHEGDDDDG